VRILVIYRMGEGAQGEAGKKVRRKKYEVRSTSDEGFVSSLSPGLV
jgi:hypothetical protein